MGYYTIYWLIYQDHLLPGTKRCTEQVELIDLMRESVFVSHNINFLTSQIKPFRAYNLVGKQYMYFHMGIYYMYICFLFMYVYIFFCVEDVLFFFIIGKRPNALNVHSSRECSCL